MANRTGLALAITLLAPALACTAVTGLGKSYEFTDEGGTTGSDASSDAVDTRDGAKADGATGTQCPLLIAGSYSMTEQGDCGNTFDKNAKQCVSTTTTVSDSCALQFVSPGAGVNGTLDAQGDGNNFRNGQITLGSVKHTGCAAVWRAIPPTITLSCTAEAGSGLCTIVMSRTTGTCP